MLLLVLVFAIVHIHTGICTRILVRIQIGVCIDFCIRIRICKCTRTIFAPVFPYTIFSYFSQPFFTIILLSLISHRQNLIARFNSFYSTFIFNFLTFDFFLNLIFPFRYTTFLFPRFRPNFRHLASASSSRLPSFLPPLLTSFRWSALPASTRLLCEMEGIFL